MSISNVLIKKVSANKQDIKKRDFLKMQESTKSIEDGQRRSNKQIMAISEGKCYMKNEE